MDYLGLGPLGCVRSINCPLHTIDWQACQDITARGPWIPAVAFLFLNTALLSLNSPLLCCAVLSGLTERKEEMQKKVKLSGSLKAEVNY